MPSLIRRERLFASLLICAAAGCGDDAVTPGVADAAPTSPDAEPPAEPDASPPDAGPTRSLALATGGVQADLAQGIFIGAANVADDADVVAIHQEFYGLPWDEFEADLPPPPEWVAKMDELLDQAEGKPIFLSLQLVGGAGRRFLADKTVIVDGNVTKLESWSELCYDFRTAPDGDAKRAAYAAYVTWMVEKFQPTYLNVAIEMNLFMPCTDAWSGVVDAQRDAYMAAKLARPDVIAFASFQIDQLYGYDDEQCPSPMTRDVCFDNAYARLDRVLRDRFAISTYPYLIEEIAAVENIPPDWFTRASSRGGEQLLVAETGWSATPAVGIYGDTCITAISSSPDDQAAYFDRLVADVSAAGGDLVTWWSDRDLIPSDVMTDCPCDFDASWCGLVDLFRSLGGDDPLGQFYGEMLLKIWGNMGLRTWGGAPREPIYSRWSAFRAMPLTP